MRINRTITFSSLSLLRITTIIIFLFTISILHSQVFDDFADGNFSADPVWTGDTSDFSISYSLAVPPELKPALKLDASGSDTSCLVVSNALVNQTEWRFWIKISFNTSSNNYARVYLVSDQPDISGVLNGYFVQLGGSNDSIGLYKQSGNTHESLIQGLNAYTGNSTNEIRVKVTRDHEGNWQLFADQEGGYDFIPEGSCQDNTFLSSAYMGIFCKYTSSNSAKFYFDDFYVDDLYSDTIPPNVVAVEVLSASELKIEFSETVVLNTVEDTLNYVVNNGFGHPLQALRDPMEFNLALLSFSEDFEDNLTYTIEIKDIVDLSGNVMTIQYQNFLYNLPPPIQPFEIVINEIMADVSPAPAGRPEADYLELYNRTTLPVSLNGATLKPRESADPLPFPDVAVEADSFLIVVNTSDVEAFSPFGQVIGLSGFSLNNEGTVVLRDQEGRLIHSINYDKSWYKDEEKQEGGWALEQIDPANTCSLSKTWKAAIDATGGTPGANNSVDDNITSEPELLSVVFIDPFTLRVEFSHFMDSVSISSLSSYIVSNGFGFPAFVHSNDLLFNGVELQFENQFMENTMYELELADTLQDYCGRYILPGEIYTFVRPTQSNPYDIVINEIMADPDPPVGLPGFEYIELFNRTSQFIQIKDWILETGNTNRSVPEIIINPGEYILFTDSEAGLIFSIFARTFVLTSLGLTNSGGSVVLKNDQGVIISATDYSKSWYSDPIKSEGGYSLEQIDPYNPCSGGENWTQTEAKEGGTPGFVNSVDAMNDLTVEITKVIVRHDTIAAVYFSQKMNKSSILEASLFDVDMGMGSPAKVYPADSVCSRFFLAFNQGFSTGKVYHISINKPVMNCIGVEMLVPERFAFGVAEAPERNDLVINEVLFNPMGDGVDFVEVYNRSANIINLNMLKLGHVSVDPFGIHDTLYKQVIHEDQLLLAGGYIVFTSNPLAVQEQYYSGDPGQFVRMETFPAYNNDNGTVILTTELGELIDFMQYDETSHHPLLNFVEGVSLERINPDRLSTDKTNWHSASSGSGFATPALRNSQFSHNDPSGAEVFIEPGIFSPDNDGYDDVANIHYHLQSPGYMPSVVIYDAKGRPVRFLINNELLGTSGSFSWDGITDDNQKATLGIYIIYFEAFDQNGNVIRNKKTVVLAGRLL